MTTDLYLRAPDQPTMDAALIDSGLCVETEEGVVPINGVALDRIGSFWRNDIEYPDYHANMRLMEPLTAEQSAILDPLEVVPPEVPFRVWA